MGFSTILGLSFGKAILELSLGILLICFEATALAKGFNWTFCQALVGIADRVTPIMRTIIYGTFSILIICIVSFGTIFGLLPTMACAAAYFLLFLDQRNSGGDTQPVVEDTNEFADPG